MALMFGAAPAPAQDDGIYINPDSPAGVEYDIPLERARRDADPERPAGSPVSQGKQTSAPFGAGIEGSESPGAVGEAPRPPRGRAARTARPSADGERRTPLPPEVVAAAARPVSPADGGDGALLYGAGGALLIVGGALAGLALRRRRN
jgi:hypothetical protein